MAAPTQEYPPWLTPSPLPVTLPGGDVETQTTIVYLPLTYYGPSIPLGSLYTYGGLTSPSTTFTPSTSATPSSSSSLSDPSSSTSPTSIIPSITITSAIPSSSSSSLSNPSSSTSPTSLQPPTTSSTTVSSSTPGPTASVTPSSTSAEEKFPNQAQLAGLIVGAVLLALFIIISVYLCVTRFTSRREMRRAGILPAFFAPSRRNDLEDDFEIIHYGDASPPPGSPRQSGEEADPFLDRSRYPPVPLTIQQMAELGIRPPSFGYPQNSSNTSISSYGTEIPSTSGFMSQRHIISPEEQLRLDSVIHEVPEPDEDVPLMPPPRLVSDRNSSNGLLPIPSPLPSVRSFTSNSTLPLDADEAGMLQTAHRVHVNDQLGNRTTAAANLIPSSEAISSRDAAGWLGLGGLANLGRLSWFRAPSEPNSRRDSAGIPPSAWSGHGMVDRDVESSRPLLTTPTTEFRSTRGIIGVGVGPGGERPRSGAQSSAHSGAQSSVNSAKSNVSGNTIYHDAPDHLPEPSPPPAVHTMNSTHRSSPLQFVVSANEDSSSLAPTSDVLDTPVPPPLRHFASNSSVKDTATINTESSITSKKLPAFPPGLPLIPKFWTTDTIPRGGATAGSAEIDPNARTSVSIDVLEQEPPIAQHGWHRMMGIDLPGLNYTAGRRTTFGGPTTTLPIIMHTPEQSSERGSLHSSISHDHLSPAPSRSAGSSEGSSRRSRRTGHASLSHSNSISEDGHRRGKLGTTNRAGAISPSMSPALSAVGEYFNAPISPVPQAQSSRGRVERVNSSVSQMPWATGLDQSWNPA